MGPTWPASRSFCPALFITGVGETVLPAAVHSGPRAAGAAEPECSQFTFTQVGHGAHKGA